LKTASLASRWGYLVAHTQTITDHRIRLSDATRGDAEPGDLLGRDRQHRGNASGLASAFFAIQHDRGVAILFIISLVAFTGIAGRFCPGGADCVERIRSSCLMVHERRPSAEKGGAMRLPSLRANPRPLRAVPLYF
jgi:hypothetical protein